MRHIYWLIRNELCARPGPNEKPWDPKELYDAGIRAVLSVNKADGVEPRELSRFGITHKRVTLPIDTPPGPKALKTCLRKLPSAYKFAQQQITVGRPVLVHCRHGNDRSGLFLAYYLARQYSMSPDQTIAEIRSRRAASLRAYGWERFARELVKQVLITHQEPSRAQLPQESSLA